MDYCRCCSLFSFIFLDFLESHLPAEDASGFVSKALVQGMLSSELHESFFPQVPGFHLQNKDSLLRTESKQVCKSLNAKSFWDNC